MSSNVIQKKWSPTPCVSFKTRVVISTINIGMAHTQGHLSFVRGVFDELNLVKTDSVTK